MITRRGIADLVTAPERTGGGRDLIGAIFEKAVRESPALDLECDRFSLLEIAAVHRVPRLAELGLGGASVVDFDGSRCTIDDSFGTCFLDILGYPCRRVVEEPPFHVEGIGLVDLVLGGVVVMGNELLASFVEKPAGACPGVGVASACARTVSPMAATNTRMLFKADWSFIYLSSKKFFSDREISAVDRAISAINRAIIAADRARDSVQAH